MKALGHKSHEEDEMKPTLGWKAIVRSMDIEEKKASWESIYQLHIEWAATIMSATLMAEWHLNSAKSACSSLSTSS